MRTRNSKIHAQNVLPSRQDATEALGNTWGARRWIALKQAENLAAILVHTSITTHRNWSPSDNRENCDGRCIKIA
jgi:hypothetical protein